MHEQITESRREVPEHFRCRHIFIDGHRCGSPALRNQHHCYYHHETRKPAPNPQARYARRRAFSIPEPRSRADIQNALGKVLTSIAFNDIDPRRAGLILYGLQIASLNITRSQSPQQNQQAPEPAAEVQNPEPEAAASQEEAFPPQLHRITRASFAGLIESFARHLNVEPSTGTPEDRAEDSTASIEVHPAEAVQIARPIHVAASYKAAHRRITRSLWLRRRSADSSAALWNRNPIAVPLAAQKDDNWKAGSVMGPQAATLAKTESCGYRNTSPSIEHIPNVQPDGRERAPHERHLPPS